MGFLTEMFARPRPQERLRYRAALALLHSMSNADRADIGIKPADFPRVAREMSSHKPDRTISRLDRDISSPFFNAIP
ncbi:MULTISPECIES: hypothetical protein [unclassified Mesorhizobium]|uniref:hypothetical protein n=2 Tax=Mesorhizobium TaxID=68287 RepID=UPI0013E3C258|nr:MULTISPECIES: hypothetical protein [unclassified Mesorhizobium]